jgi:hypothetical protein
MVAVISPKQHRPYGSNVPYIIHVMFYVILKRLFYNKNPLKSIHYLLFSDTTCSERQVRSSLHLPWARLETCLKKGGSGSRANVGAYVRIRSGWRVHRPKHADIARSLRSLLSDLLGRSPPTA